MKKPVVQERDEDYAQPRSFDEPVVVSASAASLPKAQTGASTADEPASALDYYEKAVEREGAGKLGDSLKLYRKAFRVGLPTAFAIPSSTV